MNAHTFNDFFEMNRAAMAPMTRWYEITAESAQKLVKQNLAVVENCVQYGNRQMQLLGEMKDPQKWGQESGKLMFEFGQKMVEQSSDYFKVLKETQDALVQLAETSLKSTVDAAKAKQ